MSRYGKLTQGVVKRRKQQLLYRIAGVLLLQTIVTTNKLTRNATTW